MLCESVRRFRRELALALLRHYRAHDEKIEEVVAVLLEKERYAFMVQSHTPLLQPTNAQTGETAVIREKKQR